MHPRVRLTVKHDCTRLKYAHLAILESWNTSVGVDIKKPLLLLSVLHDVNALYLILQAELLEHQSWLETIWGSGCVVHQLIEGWCGCHLSFGFKSKMTLLVVLVVIGDRRNFL